MRMWSFFLLSGPWGLLGNRCKGYHKKTSRRVFACYNRIYPHVGEGRILIGKLGKASRQLPGAVRACEVQSSLPKKQIYQKIPNLLKRLLSPCQARASSEREIYA